MSEKMKSPALIAALAGGAVAVLVAVVAAVYFIFFSTDAPTEARIKLQQLGAPFEQATFVDAIRRSDSILVDLYLTAGMNPGAVDVEGYSALTVAALTGRPDMIDRLVQAGASVNGEPSRIGVTPLIAAVLESRHDIAEALLKHGADTGRRLASGFSALDLAVLGDDVRALALLADAGASTTETGRYPQPLLDRIAGLPASAAIASEIGLATLVERSHDGQTYEATPLGLAIARGSPSLLRDLVARGADANVDIKLEQARIPLLFSVIGRGEPDRAEKFSILLEAGADPNVRWEGRSLLLAILIADQRDNPDRARWFAMLLEAGATVSLDEAEIVNALAGLIAGEEETVLAIVAAAEAGEAGGRMPLLRAALDAGREELVQAVIAKGSLEGAAGDDAQAILSAALDGFAGEERLAAVEALVVAGLPVHLEAGPGAPFLLATATRDADLVRMLASAGTRVPPAPEAANVVLSAVIEAFGGDERRELVGLLLEGGLSPQPAADDASPILRAIAADDLELAARLLASVEEGDADRLVPLLRHVIDMRKPDAIPVLLDAGGDVDSPDGQGRTLLFGAAATGDPHMVKTLLDAGARIEGEGLASPSSLIAHALRANEGDARLAVAAVLLDAGARVEFDPGDPGASPLALAVASDDVALAERLFEALGELDEARATALLGWSLAQRQGRWSAALLAAGADVNAADAEGRSLLALAYELQTEPARLETMRHLLEAGAQVSLSGTVPGNLVLTRALRAGDEAAALLLLDHVDADDASALLPALRDAVGNGLRQVAARLLEVGVFEAWPDTDEPLGIWAYKSERGKALIDLLSTHGVDLEAVHNQDITLFWLAWDADDRATMELLSALGVEDRRTPERASRDLFSAQTDAEILGVLNYLASIGAFPDAAVSGRPRPMVNAARTGKENVLDRLMAMEVPIGMDAVKAAQENGHGAIANRLMGLIIQGNVPVIAPRIEPGDIRPIPRNAYRVTRIEPAIPAGQTVTEPVQRLEPGGGETGAPADIRQLSPARPAGDAARDAGERPVGQAGTAGDDESGAARLAPAMPRSNQREGASVGGGVPAADDPDRLAYRPVPDGDEMDDGSAIHAPDASARRSVESAERSAPQAAAACLDWNAEARLEGTVVEREFPGPPNWESLAAGDQRLTALLLRLDRPFCLVGGDAEMGQEDLDSVTFIHIVPESAAVTPSVGVQVSLGGFFMERHTGYHQTAALLMVSRMEVLSARDGIEGVPATGQALPGLETDAEEEPAGLVRIVRQAPATSVGLDLTKVSEPVGNVRFVTTRANLRSEPNTRSPVVDVLERGAMVAVIETLDADWHAVDYDGAHPGVRDSRAYIHRDLLTPETGPGLLRMDMIPREQARWILGNLADPVLDNGSDYFGDYFALARADLNDDGASELILYMAAIRYRTQELVRRLIVIDGGDGASPAQSHRVLLDWAGGGGLQLAVGQRSEAAFRDIVVFEPGPSVLSWDGRSYGPAHPFDIASQQVSTREMAGVASAVGEEFNPQAIDEQAALALLGSEAVRQMSEDGTQIKIAWVDLNGDGGDELVVTMEGPDWDGSMGWRWLVLSGPAGDLDMGGDTNVLLDTLGTAMRALPGRTGGWADLARMSRSGEVVHRWNGRAYEE